MKAQYRAPPATASAAIASSPLAREESLTEPVLSYNVGAQINGAQARDPSAASPNTERGSFFGSVSLQTRILIRWCAAMEHGRSTRPLKRWAKAEAKTKSNVAPWPGPRLAGLRSSSFVGCADGPPKPRSRKTRAHCRGRTNTQRMETRERR